MQTALRVYVKNKLFDAEQLPFENSRRFYPEERDICDHMYNATSKLPMSKADQENVSLLIEKRQKTNPGDLFFFRPHGTNSSAGPLGALSIMSIPIIIRGMKAFFLDLLWLLNID